MTTTNPTFDEYLSQKLRVPSFQAAWEESKPAYELKRLRILKKLSQAQLARKVGTKQPSIARLESGYGLRNLTFLKKVADALDANVEIRITPRTKTAAPTSSPRRAKNAGTRSHKKKLQT